MALDKKRRKLFEYVFTLLLIITINFFLPRLMPGDPFLNFSSNYEEVVTLYTADQLDYYRAYYGLDKPLLNQYGNYLVDLLQGDLGFSYYYQQEVTTILLQRLPWTLFLMITATLCTVLLALWLGTYSAWRKGQWQDKWLYGVLVFLGEIPSFLLGLAFLFLLAVQLDLFPMAGAMTPFVSYQSWAEQVGDLLYHAALPLLTLIIARLGEYYLLVRNTLLTIIPKDYIRTARAKALGEATIRYRHGLRNALLPLVTRVALQMGSMIGAVVLVENVFSYPGLGLLMQQAVMVRDYPLLQGIFLFLAIVVMSANVLADLVSQYLDPRTRDNAVTVKGESDHQRAVSTSNR
ncbi:ABC transporter permease [Heliorestis convoluta]|uniref:ABC transporter permease n=1 Tax=Heliorestis convoluta TaxID=356322 RepID=A0A5Q2N236_9FIRM|nr:ABC transporter permease [Heliorestis convoluta]QGG49058.1 ABC transporter permease [Heliorestis convoluta]